MNKIHNPQRLLESLCSLPKETSWVEFKENKFNEDSVGQYVSALANSAMLEEKDAAYLIFGVRDTDHMIIGTTVDLIDITVGSEDFIFWLNKYLDPHITITPISFKYDGKRIEMIYIEPGYRQPVKFKRISYVRVESNQQPLSNYPERERALWQITSRYSFETAMLGFRISGDQICDTFHCNALLEKIGNGGKTPNSMLDILEKRGLIRNDLQDRYEVTTLLAIICARDFNHFSLLENKGVRVIVYKGRDKLSATEDISGKKGYLVAFSSILSHIMSNIPSKEVIEHGVRKKTYSVPEISVREFLANAVVHQDFTQMGSRATVEVFKDKIKITNPGVPIVSVDRFIDTPSRTRNPRFAELMRNAGLVEQRGSGVDRAIREIEKSSLPPPLIEAIEGSTVVTVFMPRSFSDMTPEERIRACFQHACLCYEANDPMSNSSLRTRFGLSQKQYPQVSIVIRDAINANRIRPLNEEQGNRNARYVPFYVT